MAWAYLIGAGALEVLCAFLMKRSKGFTVWKPALGCWLSMVCSIYLLSLATKEIPIGTAYGVWTGIGSAGSVVVGMLWMGESRAAKRILCLVLIIVGVVGLKLTS